MSRALLLALIPAALAMAAPAFGAELRTNAEPVFYSDLNLDSDAGAEAMLGRLRHAAGEACSETPGKRPLREWDQARACVADAMDRAVAELDNPTVTALHQGRRATVTVAGR